MGALRGRGRFRRPDEAGLTAVELMVVLVLLALLVFASYPSLSNVLQVMATKGAAEQTVAAIRLARQFAVSRGENVCIEFRPSSPYTQYRIMQADTASPPACTSTVIPGHDVKDIGGGDYGENVLGAGSLVFDPIGNRVNPAGTTNTTLTVRTNPVSCNSTITVTPFGGVRVAGC